LIRDQEYQNKDARFRNLEADLPGRTETEEIILIGAHYDSVIGSPGVDDNASGVAAVLELAQKFEAESLDRTLRFVAFTNHSGRRVPRP